MSPALAVADIGDRCKAHAGNDRQSVRGDAGGEQSTYVDDLLGGQLCIVVVFANASDQACSPLVLGVLCKADPLKIAWRVVGLVAVDVVHRQARLIPVAEGERNQPVQALLHALSFAHGRHFQIAISFKPWGDVARPEGRDELLGLAVSHAHVLRGVRPNADAAKSRNRPLDALRFNVGPGFYL